MFQPSDILTKDELIEAQERPVMTNGIYKKAIDLRLRVKELDIERIGVAAEDYKHVVFFVNPVLLQASSKTADKHLFAEIDNFDIRKGISKCLFTPSEQTQREPTPDIS